MPVDPLWSKAAEGNTKAAQEKNDWVIDQVGHLVRNVPSGRTNFPDHSNGRCSDFMITSKKNGDDLAAFQIRNHKKLGINLIIWHGQIWRTYSKPGIPAFTWAPYYGSPNHNDHNHTEFNDKRMSGADRVDDVVDQWDGKSFPGKDAFHIGKRHEAVKVLGRRLIVHGFVDHHDGDGYQAGTTFTKYDVWNVRDFQLAQGWKGTKRGQDADGYPGAETWKRLMADPKAKAPKGRTMPKSQGWYHIDPSRGLVQSYTAKGAKEDRKVQHPYNVYVNEFFENSAGHILGRGDKHAYWIGNLDLGLIHVVAKGETLSQIANRYGTTWQKIAADTHSVKDPNKLAVDQRLLVKKTKK